MVRTELSAVLDTGADTDADVAFREMGIDSSAAMELRNRLVAALDIRLPATVVFDHPTTAELVAHLHARLTGTGTPRPNPRPPPRVRLRRTHRDRRHGLPLPRRRRLPEELWRLVSTGGDAVSAFPTDRGWDLAELYDPSPAPRQDVRARGRLPVRRRRVRPRLLRHLAPRGPRHGPQQRLLLETSWEVFERAGIDPSPPAPTTSASSSAP
ncbi:beta-ketoacyl synthase N-terminal-like domain-containing protein [Streptomyces sp. M19]